MTEKGHIKCVITLLVLPTFTKLASNLWSTIV